MYAVIEAGGQQFRVESNSRLNMDLLPGEVGSEVEFKNVLLVRNGDKTVVGKPYIQNAAVKAEIVEHKKDRKVLVFHKIPKGAAKKIRGHRQPYTVVRIKEIIGG